MESRSTSQHEKACRAWTPVGPTPADTLLTLTFAIKERNTEQLLGELDSISNPLSPRYGKVITGRGLGGTYSLAQFFET
jgi:hypothetical protein